MYETDYACYADIPTLSDSGWEGLDDDLVCPDTDGDEGEVE